MPAVMNKKKMIIRTHDLRQSVSFVVHRVLRNTTHRFKYEEKKNRNYHLRLFSKILACKNLNIKHMDAYPKAHLYPHAFAARSLAYTVHNAKIVLCNLYLIMRVLSLLHDSIVSINSLYQSLQYHRIIISLSQFTNIINQKHFITQVF